MLRIPWRRRTINTSRRPPDAGATFPECNAGSFTTRAGSAWSASLKRCAMRPPSPSGILVPVFWTREIGADLFIVDTQKEWTITPQSLRYKCAWSPLEGHTFKGTVESTIVNGHGLARRASERSPHGHAAGIQPPIKAAVPANIPIKMARKYSAMNTMAIMP